MASEAQRKANEKWKSKNKEKAALYRYRSQARKFVRDMATAKDLDELSELIKQRRDYLK